MAQYVLKDIELNNEIFMHFTYNGFIIN